MLTVPTDTRPPWRSCHATSKDDSSGIPPELSAGSAYGAEEPESAAHERWLASVGLGPLTCYRPLRAYASAGGPRFTHPGAGIAEPMRLPCGQCIGCRIRRAQEWTDRCEHEAALHETNSFITLTYDDESVPADGSLRKKHWQDFAKRLRKHLRFRYFHCGEYGDSFQRPHYHACIFGQDFTEDRQWLKRPPDPMWTSPLLEQTWGHGMVSVRPFCTETAAYVARYAVKKVTGKKAREHYRRVAAEDIYEDGKLVRAAGEEYEVPAEYATQSRRPGLGAKWFEQFATDVFPSDEIVNAKGRTSRPPRYYEKLVNQLEETHNLDPSFLEGVKEQRRVKALKHAKNQSRDRLQAREAVAEAKWDLGR